MRLRTNLEIYWDSLGYAVGTSASSLKSVRLDPATADLGYRGFSETRSEKRDEPEIPIYDRIANTVPRWRDLVGYYTRFGDVRELLAGVDDRYVIMNAGDELRLSFAALPPPPKGWARDFVLIGDGWEQGRRLQHRLLEDRAAASGTRAPRLQGRIIMPTLEEDPVYQRHRDDWQKFHTRYVSPDAFLSGLTMASKNRQP